MQIAKNMVVSIHYTLTNDEGEVLDSSDGQEPLTYLHGSHGIVPGLENALEGKVVGDSLQVSLAPEDGYGERIDELTQVVPRTAFGGADLELGMQFRAEGDNHHPLVFTIIDIDGDDITIDGNHPLSGETLNFDVEIMSVRAASAEEIAHGHVHGAGGHHH
jgi:FKBP-type peptidyl-prolyl cis-trans isomerase SlyD